MNARHETASRRGRLFALLALGALGLGACEEGLTGIPADKSVDHGPFNTHSLKEVKWGIWVDPDGCDHWIADDGVEGYLVARLDREGRPVCSGIAPPTYTAGDFKGGSPLPDPN